MEIVSVLRVLRRRRLIMAVGALVALLVGIGLMTQSIPAPAKLQSRSTVIGASARVLLVVAPQKPRRVQDELTESLGIRALLLADLMTTDDVRARIAGAAGVPADQVVIRGPSTGPPELEVPLALKAADAAAMATEAYGLTVSVDPGVPILSFKVTAPDVRSAKTVVDAAVGRLGQLIASRSRTTPMIRVAPLGSAVGSTVVTHVPPVFPIAAAILIFLMWCAAMVLVSGLDRWWRGRGQTPELSHAG